MFWGECFVDSCEDEYGYIRAGVCVCVCVCAVCVWYIYIHTGEEEGRKGGEREWGVVCLRDERIERGRPGPEVVR